MVREGHGRSEGVWTSSIADGVVLQRGLPGWLEAGKSEGGMDRAAVSPLP